MPAGIDRIKMHPEDDQPPVRVLRAMRLRSRRENETDARVELPCAAALAHQADTIHDVPDQVVRQWTSAPLPAGLAMPVGRHAVETYVPAARRQRRISRHMRQKCKNRRRLSLAPVPARWHYVAQQCFDPSRQGERMLTNEHKRLYQENGY